MLTTDTTLQLPTQRIAFALASLLAAIACGGEPFQTTTVEIPTVTEVRFVDVTPQQWSALESRRLLFGHQSVGSNIVQGIAEVLARHPELKLRVVEANPLDKSAQPGLYHARIGQNGDPESKRTAFADLADSIASDVAMMKFCYLDVDGRTDPNSLFAAYKREMTELRTRHPGLDIVHITMPLTDQGNWKERLMKGLKRQATARQLNRIRNRYNALLRDAYLGKEPVFDLARLESTRDDGSRVFFLEQSEPIYYLAPELTDDGGHLNPAGRRIVSERFLAFLATL